MPCPMQDHESFSAYNKCLRSAPVGSSARWIDHWRAQHKYNCRRPVVLQWWRRQAAPRPGFPAWGTVQPSCLLSLLTPPSAPQGRRALGPPQDPKLLTPEQARRSKEEGFFGMRIEVDRRSIICLPAITT